MAFVTPFRGVRFNQEKVGNLEGVVTPPYDIIDGKAQAVYLQRSPYNMINLDLGKERNLTDENRFRRAKEFFDNWLANQILIREPAPALYPYMINYFLPGGKRLVRQGFIALVRLAEFTEGVVKPHEHTFSEVTSERLQLLDTCRAQFSPIFSLYPDRKGEVNRLLTNAKPTVPLAEITDNDGNIHTIWQINDPRTLQRVHDFFIDQPLYIADGHHRYTTALHLRALMTERHGGKLPEDSPFNHVMMYLSDMDDPGLAVLPTHRLLRLAEGLPISSLVERLGSYFEVEEIGDGSREVLIAQVLARMDELGQAGAAIGVYQADNDRCFLLRLKAGVMDRLFGDTIPAALRELDVVVLSELIFGHILGLEPERCEKEGMISFLSDPDEGLDFAIKETRHEGPYEHLLFLLNPTPVAQVRRVADEGLVMPHKSTYFYPKILTGLVMNQMIAEEKVGLF